MATTDEQIHAMRNLCTALVGDGSLVRDAYINDWGKFGNFELFVIPKTPERSSTVRLKAVIARQMPKGATLRSIHGPEPIRDRNPWTRKTVTRGYRSDRWSVDVDFTPYFEGINRFQSQLEGETIDGYPSTLPINTTPGAIAT